MISTINFLMNKYIIATLITTVTQTTKSKPYEYMAVPFYLQNGVQKATKSANQQTLPEQKDSIHNDRTA